MMQITLEDEEKETLIEILKNALSEIRDEAIHTDRLFYKQQLMARANLVQQLLSKMT